MFVGEGRKRWEGKEGERKERILGGREGGSRELTCNGGGVGSGGLPVPPWGIFRPELLKVLVSEY